MNKDVIYIEPEDDITDILTKVKNSKSKIVALVPPKKAGVLRSAVNFKLIAKTARETEKTAVLITTDESLVKLAGTVRIPVAKNLQTKPEVPVALVVSNNTVADDDVIDGEEAKAIVAEEKRVEKVANAGKGDAKKKSEGEAVAEIAADNQKYDDEISSDDLDKPEEGKKGKKKKSLVPDFTKYRKFIILGVAGAVLLIGFLVWALVFAPAAKIAVTVRTTAKNFSENVSFVTSDEEADPGAGIFWLEEQKVVKTAKVEFDATGEVDKGAKAAGTLNLKRTSPVSQMADALTIAKGTKFTIDELTYVTTEVATLAAPGADNCVPIYGTMNCNITKDIAVSVKVVAEFAGTKYNIEESASGWGPIGKGYTISSAAMTGGTTRVVKVVSEADIARAKESLDSTNETEGKSELMREFSSSLIPIEASFVVKLGDPTASPALDAEVTDGVKPELTAETTFTMYGVDRQRVTEYIEKMALANFGNTDMQKIYETGVSDDVEENKAFIESFREEDKKYSAKLKSVVQIGPEVTDAMVAEKSLGKKIGEVQTQLKSINGISAVKVDTSFFWVSSVPSDSNKVTIEITVE